MIRSGRNLILVIGLAVAFAGCGGGGSPSGPTQTPPPPKNFTATGTLTMTSAVEGVSNQYTATIQVSEHGGLGATMGDVDITYSLGGAPLATATWESSQAWVGGTRLNALNNIASNFLVATDPESTIVPDSATATLHYTDDNQKVGTVTLNASIPAPPEPPPGSRFTVTGTVTESPKNTGLKEATITVQTGETAGKSTKTDSKGHYTLKEVGGGIVTIRASKSKYNAADQTINLRANSTLNFTMTKSGGLMPDQPVASPEWMRFPPRRLLATVK